MHPIHAQLLGVTPLKLKAQYSKASVSSDEHQVEIPSTPLTLSPQLKQDILLAAGKEVLEFVQGEQALLAESSLYLPSAQLTAEQKKQLWRVIYDASS
ncbi:hypothetical protein N474_07735 [Pseudoalteromonas luteoviolacea CPMOR-2]|uniref:Uncharacterized protein n=1 Tax=Pseudoalteromonas luteoviolacea DSM 6061 TaxID=1365250 RepID=A0A166X4H5_9GAMM|nr:hypothetical protein [Pseudoalteromonas luteoviolacea]KZN39593.1 hypothetical protein N475_14345 [Pseudoalteromonas luteoviolacea DSM 6061]KZN57862.1 hypothetical protein N474_07735 [Pseudoalteromonas luteoviolacea CPMOR-2]MBE0388355.1 hypothetical protein [Pseudoalteromonas luteoviolacea DSM 6061]